jgi:hypothetical protein
VSGNSRFQGVLHDAGLARARSHFKENFPLKTEADISKSLKVIVCGLVKTGRGLSKGRSLRFGSDSNKEVISGIEIDASLNNVAGSLHTTNTVVATEFEAPPQL